MSFCDNCGEEIKNLIQKFCEKCGSAVQPNVQQTKKVPTPIEKVFSQPYERSGGLFDLNRNYYVKIYRMQHRWKCKDCKFKFENKIRQCPLCKSTNLRRRKSRNLLGLLSGF